MEIIFLDFDGVMDTVYYGHVLGKEGDPGSDEFGAIFDPDCVRNLKEIIDKTGTFSSVAWIVHKIIPTFAQKSRQLWAHISISAMLDSKV